MNKVKLLLAIFMLVGNLSGAWANEEERACKGGDGGIPMIDISGQIGVNHGVIQTRGLVSDFVYWEKKNTLVYRNAAQEVWTNALANGSERLIGSLSAPLAHLTDPSERYLVTEDDVQIFDTQSSPPQVAKLKFTSPLKKLLFWGSDTIFGAMAERADVYQKLNFFSYRAGSTKAYSCLLPAHPGELYELAEGHQFPYAFMYKQKNTPRGVELSLYRVLLESGSWGKACSLQYMKTYLNRLPARVKMVYQFPNWNAFAVSLDHPTKNLLWDYGSQCIYYNLNNATPVVTNFKEPLIMTWEGPSGLGILSPIRGRSIHVLKGFTPRNVGSRQLWMTGSGRKIIAGIQPEGHAGRMVFQVNLNQLP